MQDETKEVVVAEVQSLPPGRVSSPTPPRLHVIFLAATVEFMLLTSFPVAGRLLTTRRSLPQDRQDYGSCSDKAEIGQAHSLQQLLHCWLCSTTMDDVKDHHLGLLDKRTCAEGYHKHSVDTSSRRMAKGNKFKPGLPPLKKRKTLETESPALQVPSPPLFPTLHTAQCRYNKAVIFSALDKTSNLPLTSRVRLQSGKAEPNISMPQLPEVSYHPKVPHNKPASSAARAATVKEAVGKVAAKRKHVEPHGTSPATAAPSKRQKQSPASAPNTGKLPPPKQQAQSGAQTHSLCSPPAVKSRPSERPTEQKLPPQDGRQDQEKRAAGGGKKHKTSNPGSSHSAAAPHSQPRKPGSANPGRSKAANHRKKARQKAKRLAAEGGGVMDQVGGGKAAGLADQSGAEGRPVKGGMDEGKNAIVGLAPPGKVSEGGKERRWKHAKGKRLDGKAGGAVEGSTTDLQQPQLGETLRGRHSQMWSAYERIGHYQFLALGATGIDHKVRRFWRGLRQWGSTAAEACLERRRHWL